MDLACKIVLVCSTEIENGEAMTDCLSYGFTAVNRHHDQGKSYKGHLIWAGLQVQRFSPLSSRQEQGSVRADVGLEELRVPPLVPKAARRRRASRQLGWWGGGA